MTASAWCGISTVPTPPWGGKRRSAGALRRRLRVGSTSAQALLRPAFDCFEAVGRDYRTDGYDRQTGDGVAPQGGILYDGAERRRLRSPAANPDSGYPVGPAGSTSKPSVGRRRSSGNAYWTSNNYWSSTENSNNSSNAWNVNFNNGNTNNNDKSNNNYVRCIRQSIQPPAPHPEPVLIIKGQNTKKVEKTKTQTNRTKTQP